MRIRSIKPEFFHHEGLFEAEIETNLPLRVAFAGLWCIADREGRFKWEPRRIGVQVLPYDGVDFSRVLDALTTRGFVVKYRVGDVCFGCIPSFLKHQVINNRESQSVLPDPEGNIEETPINTEEFDASATREPRDDDACTKEGKGREGKEGVPQKHASELSAELDAFRIRIGSWFKRRPETRWSDKEIKLLEEAFESGFTSEELDLLEKFYCGNSKYKRRDIKTLLNNWNTEIDRAKGEAGLFGSTTGKPEIDPTDANDLRNYL
jgi:hypothetical protein